MRTLNKEIQDKTTPSRALQILQKATNFLYKI